MAAAAVCGGMLLLPLAGCRTTPPWHAVGAEALAFPSSDATVPDPFASATDDLLARMRGPRGVAPPGDGMPRVGVAVDRVELLDASPPPDLPGGDALRTRLRAALAEIDWVQAVDAGRIPGTPVLLGSGTAPRWTLNLEAFRLADSPKVPDRAFYLLRLWVFDLQDREPVWEAIADPIAWPRAADADESR